MTPTLTFLGAAGTVTGSCTLIEFAGRRVLVDCGMFQGPKSLKELNYRPFPFVPAEIDAVLLTHAHIDHSGLIPKLFKEGFKGPVYATEGTRDLLAYMLPDSGYIQETEVERLNSRRDRHGEEPLEPIYRRIDAEQSLRIVTPIGFGDWIPVIPGVKARYWPAGHILGAASIEIDFTTGSRSVSALFSGDIGTTDHALHRRPEGPKGIDYVVSESTYGDRVRGPVTAEMRRRALLEDVKTALSRGGVLVIPVFAVERTQELLYDLGLLMHRGDLPMTPIFLDSPLATHATEVFSKHLRELGDAAAHPHPFDGPQVHFVETVEQSEKLASLTGGAIIMAASGMCDAGRIRHHLLNHLWRPQSTVLIVGYQAPGTLGRLLLDGAQAVRIMGHEVLVRAAIREIDIYSAHADQSELIDWVKERLPVRRAVILTHGEATASTTLAERLAEALPSGLPVLVPALGNRLALDPAAAPMLEAGTPPISAPDLARQDWHNLRSRFLLDLSEALRRAPDDRDRARLLADLQERLPARR